jgi:hypothetical protein
LFTTNDLYQDIPTNLYMKINPSIRRFLMRLVIVGSCIGCILAVLIVFAGVDQESHLLSLIDKQARLASVRGPKLVIIGGSSSAFGIDGEQLTAHSGRAIANLGVNASYGVDLMTNMTLPTLQPGDVVLFNLEYDYYFTKDNWLGMNGLYNLYLFYSSKALRSELLKLPHALWLMVEDIPYFLQSRYQALLGKWLKPETVALCQRTVYCRQSYHLVYGDNRNPAIRDSASIRSFYKQTPNESQYIPRNVERLMAAIAAVEAKGAVAFISFPPTERLQGYNNMEAAIERLYQAILKDSGKRVLFHPSAAALPLEWMFDTIYHTNLRGKAAYTKLLQDKLLPKMPSVKFMAIS